MQKLFITGIGTDIGKTIVSAIITEALQADYWKPIQAGTEKKDSDIVRELISNSKSVIHPEQVTLKAPMSPHAAAVLENKTIQLTEFKLPTTSNTLIIEGAGGLLVPINDNEFVADMINYFDAKVILVSKNYLGSINHTLLSFELLKKHKCNVGGIIFNGEENSASEKIILKHTGYKYLGHIFPENNLSKDVIKKYATQLYPRLVSILAE